uniref:Uncharacterized protein n=1 Tax=Arcella intermedia TaxID=1963864 RepID=A0A6B2L3D9_9EUKA
MAKSDMKLKDWVNVLHNIHLNKEKLVELFDESLQLAQQGITEYEVIMGFLHCTTLDSARDALDWFKKAANKGHAFAQYATGTIYLHGSTSNITDPIDSNHSIMDNSIYYIDTDNLEQFLGEASKVPSEEDKKFNFRKWLKQERLKFKKQQENEEKESCKSQEIDINVQEGLEWLTLAAKNHSLEAQLSLAEYYLNLEPANLKSAEEWLLCAVELNCTSAMYKLGEIYYAIWETSRDNSDRETWFYWFKRAAEGGNGAACFWIGYAYDNDLLDVDNDLKLNNSLEWLKKAVQLDNKQAMHYLGMMFRDKQKGVYDLKESRRYLEKAAAPPDPYPEALFALGDLHLNGDEGFEKNPQLALKYFKEAGKLGHSDALCNVGAIYYNGIGTDVDFEKAFYAYQNASIYDNKCAHKNLHDMYANGVGVPKSEVSAEYHLQKMLGNDTTTLFLPDLLNEISQSTDTHPTQGEQ